MTFVVPSDIRQLILDYEAAYENVNGKPAPIITYTDGGWFKFGNLRPRYRRSAIMEMIQTLRERTAHSISSTTSGGAA